MCGYNGDLRNFVSGASLDCVFWTQCLYRIENDIMSPVSSVTKQISEPGKKERVFCYVSCFLETGDDRNDKREKKKNAFAFI